MAEVTIKSDGGTYTYDVADEELSALYQWLEAFGALRLPENRLARIGGTNGVYRTNGTNGKNGKHKPFNAGADSFSGPECPNGNCPL
jgi:hypothetical protein